MTDYPTWARGSMMVDWEHRIDMDRMRRERVEKTQAAMKEKGIDALILWKDENVRYLTSARVIMIQYRSSTTYGVLLRQEGNPTLLASSGEAHRIEECMPWIDDYVPIGILEEPGLVEHTVGTDIKTPIRRLGRVERHNRPRRTHLHPAGDDREILPGSHLRRRRAVHVHEQGAEDAR